MSIKSIFRGSSHRNDQSNLSRGKGRFGVRKVKFIIIFICLLIVSAEIIPPMFAQADSLGRTVTYYGFFEAHQEMLDKKNSRINTPEILNNTETRLDAMEPISVNPISDHTEFEVETKGVPSVNPDDRAPPILDASQRSTIWNKSSVMEFLIDQPLNYMIITFYEDNIIFTKGVLRPTLIIPKTDIGTDWGWNEINVDGDTSTGVGPNGAEIKARMRFRLANITDISLRDRTITIEGNLVIEVEKLVTNDLPIEIFFAKYASYEGRNFIVNVGYKFDNTPTQFIGRALIKKIVIGGVGETILMSIIGSGIGNISTGNVAEVSGPYSIFYESTSHLKALDVSICMIRIENLTLIDWSWLKLIFRNKPDLPSIPMNGELWLHNTQLYAPIDTVIWNAGPFDAREQIPFLFSIEFYETRETLIYAIGHIEEMPPFLRLAMDYTQQVDGKNITILEYESDYSVDKIEYFAYEFPFYKGTGNVEDFNVTHVIFRYLPLKFKFEVTADVGRNLNDTISRNPTAGIVANLIDNIIIRVARRFYRIGESLKTLALSITTLPQRKGWAELNAYSGEFGQIDLYRSSNQYLSMENDFISFFNDTNEDYPGYLVDFPIAAKLRDINYMKASFKDDTEIVFKHRGGRSLSIVFVDGEDFAFAEFSDMPSQLSIVVTDYLNTFASYCIDTENPEEECDYTSDEALESRINRFKFYSKSEQQYMELEITDIPNYMTIANIGHSIEFNTREGDYIGAFEFIITNNSAHPVSRLESDHYGFIEIQPEFSAASGKLTGVEQIVYDPSKGGKTELRLRNESEFNIRMINNHDDRVDASIILDPLPSYFSMEMPGAINSSITRLPDLINITGEVDFSNVVFAFSNLGNDIIGIMNNISHNVVDLVGAVSSNLSFAYDLEGFGSSLDIIARIEKGPNNLIPDLAWSHGVIMAAEETEDAVGLKGNIYLQGLPPNANFTSRFGIDDIYLNLEFKNYRPQYDWLYVERKGLQSRDMNLYLDNFRQGINLKFEVNLTTNVTIGGRTEGMIDIECTDAFTNEVYNLGNLHVNLLRYDNFMSNTEVFISEIPSTFHIDLSMYKSTQASYQASEPIEFLYIDMAKKLYDEWYHSYILFHDLPTWFEVNMTTNPTYEMDKPLPLQGMPDITINSGSQTMDIVAHSTGRVNGQRGNVDIQLENVNSLQGKLIDDTYKITSAGVDFIHIMISDLPLLENFEIQKLELIAEDLRSIEFSFYTLFGVYPIFEISNLNGGAFELNLVNEMELFGSKRHMTISMIDITYSSHGSMELPSETPVYNNGISFEMDSSKRHVIVPAPFLSLTATTLT
ncbi:MAG: hypothetical protein JSV49_09560 [Thermoplasmata archaeon]|nr:MAG: hypothetical protein JSV49_09560 [Thermoplasmata archaeon]